MATYAKRPIIDWEARKFRRKVLGCGRLVGMTSQFSLFCFFGGVAKNGLYFHVISETALFFFLNYMPR